MAINKVLLGSNVLIDITDTTATASDVAMGKNFYTNDGVKRTGTKSDASPVNVELGIANVSNETLIFAGNSTETYYLKFKPSSELSNTNRLSLQLVASEKCFVLVHATSRPSAPSSGYKALYWSYQIYRFNNEYAYTNTSHAIVRANNTIGTDLSQCVFDQSTGELKVGGQYGHFFPEDEYEIVQIVFN